MNRVHISIIPLAGDRITGPVTVREKRWSVVGDKAKQEHNYGSGDPTKLTDSPSKRKHAGTDHRRDNMRTRRPYITLKFITLLQWNMNPMK